MTRLLLTAGCLGLIVFATSSIAAAADRQRQTTGQNARWHIAGRQPSVRSRGTSHGRGQYPLGGSSQYSRGSQHHSQHHGTTHGGSTYGGYGYGYGGYNRPTYVLPALNYVFIPGRGFVPVRVNYGYRYGYGF